MYIGRTPALGELRAQLGQTQRELVTLLVGLEAVRAGREEGAAAMRAPWRDGPEREQSVRHARRFVCDAALGRVVDALDGYLAALRRMDAVAARVPAFAALQERSVKARLEALTADVDVGCPREVALAHLAIQWRNRRLHSGAANRLEQRYVAALRAEAEAPCARLGGVQTDALLEHFEASRSPRFRELVALARATGTLGARLDRAVLLGAPAETYAQEALSRAFREAEGDGARQLAELWSRPPEKRQAKLRQILRTLGFRDRPLADDQCALPDAWLDELAGAGHREAAARLGLVEERAAPRDAEE